MSKSRFSLSNPFQTLGFWLVFPKCLVLLASPTGFEPVLSP
jgi:hypothetical protein